MFYRINKGILINNYTLGSSISLTFVNASRNPITDDPKCNTDTLSSSPAVFTLDGYFGQCASQIELVKFSCYKIFVAVIHCRIWASTGRGQRGHWSSLKNQNY